MSNFADLEAIRLIEKSQISPENALVQQAGDRVLQQYHGGLWLPLLSTLTGSAYAFSVMASPPLGIAIAAVGLLHMVDKVRQGERAFDEIENGRFDRYLNEQQRRILEAIKDAPTAPALPSAVEGGTMPAPPIARDWNEQQWRLWNAIARDCPELRYPLQSKLVVISGPQQTGKSSLAAAIAYCRSFLFGWPATAITPHPDGLKIFDGQVIGHGRNFSAIEAFYEAMVEGFSMGGDRRSLIIDELTQYQGDHAELGKALVRTALSESDKHGYAPILLNHAKTLSAGFAGIKGMRELIDNSALQLTRQYQETEWGEMVRSPVVEMVRPGQEAIAIRIPDWLYLPHLRGRYPMPAAAVAAATDTERQVEPPANPFQLTPDMLQRIYDASPSEEELPADLPSEAAAIAQYAARRRGEWVKARDCQRNITKFGGYSADQVREWFTMLAARGIGEASGEGESLKYRR